MQNPVEMANTLAAVEQRLNADPSYRAEFAKAWGPGPITYEMVEKSIASFERSVVSGNSPFDRWKYGHDKKAVDSSVKRGFVVFTSKKKGNCAVCHEVGDKYALFTDNKFHDVGVAVDMGNITPTLALTPSPTSRPTWGNSRRRRCAISRKPHPT